jgi:hypothetical protein
MKNTLKHTILAASISALSTLANAGLDFEIIASSNYHAAEVTNDGTVLYRDYFNIYTSPSASWFTWNEDNGEQIVPGFNMPIRAGHISNDGNYMVIVGNDSWYNYHTPEGITQRGQTGFSGRIIKQISGDGKKLLAFNNGSISFYEENGAYEISNPRSPDYRITLPLANTSEITMPSRSINNDGSRVVIKYGSTAYFVDIPDSGLVREGQLTAIPHEVHSISALSDDGTSVIGAMRGLSANCPISSFHYSENKGLTDLGCTEDFPARYISGDGSKVIAHDFLGNIPALIWDEINGTRDIQEILSNNGYNTTNWTAFMPSDISEDGTKIVGWGVDGDGASQIFKIESVPECTLAF